MKKCRSCGKSISKLSRCRQCLDKENARQRSKYKKRLKSGLCPRCGDVATLNKNHCEACSSRTTERDQQRRKNRFINGFCTQCGRQPPEPNRKLCANCAITHAKRVIARETKLSKLGLCTKCGKDQFLPSMSNRTSKYKECLMCYLKRTARNNLGSETFAHFLLEKLEEQKWICPYTGDKLVLGENDSVDHIHPQKRFPDQATDLNNIEWISRRVNMMKQDLLPDEFLDLIAKIYHYRVK